jgi:hypothetical protein
LPQFAKMRIKRVQHVEQELLMNDELVITMAAAKTEGVDGGGKAGDNDKLAADEHTKQSTLSGNGNGSSNCEGDLDDNMAT